MREITLDTTTLKLSACCWGETETTPVLALHGWLDNAASFQPLAAYLTDIQIVALDLPGHGHSEHRPIGALYHFIDYISDVLAAADALGWERFSLLGHSLGAGIASFVAAAAPERITGLALIDGIGPVSGSAQDGPDRLRRSLVAQRQLASKKQALYPDIQAAARVRHELTGLSIAAAELIAQRATKPITGGIAWRSDRRLMMPSPFYFSESQVQAMLRAIQAPSVFIRALEGVLIKQSHISERCACIPHLQVIDLPGGHHLHMELPQSVGDKLRVFFDAL